MRPIQNYNVSKCTFQRDVHGGEMTSLHNKSYAHNNNIYSGYKYISILKNNGHSFPILQFFSGH